MSSIIKIKLGEYYKRLNDIFPGIEGNLFMQLDPYIVAEALDRETQPEITLHHLSFNLLQDKDVRIVFDYEQRRLHLDISTNYKRKRTKLTTIKVDLPVVKDNIRKRFNIAHYSNRHNSNYVYSFRYNYRNCKMIVDIINFIQYELVES